MKAVFGRQRDAGPAPRTRLAAPASDVTRIARLLALGWKVRRLLDAGALPDQREAAARLGIVFPQMTHVLNLTYLAPSIQARILSGELIVAEARLRGLCRIVGWQRQESTAA
jgi:hypothetical protein